MIAFEQEEFDNASAKIKVIGVGGAGGNAVRRMIEAALTGIEFYAVNTDQQALSTCHGATQIKIGENTTKGLGAGSNPEIGAKAANEDREYLQEIVDSANMVFVAAGMGGGTGTGAAPIVASLAKEKGALTIGVVTLPFNFEGRRRSDNAEAGLMELRNNADSVIVVPNQRLIDNVDRKLPIPEAFKIGDEILLHGVQSISDIITEAGEINVDFADVETVMRDAGTALMGMGRATGENRAVAAAERAILSPLLEETNISGAVGMIVNITSPPDFTMAELDETMRVIVEASQDAEPIFGLVYSDELELKDEVLVTVIATGFDPPAESNVNVRQGVGQSGGFNRSVQPNPMLQGSRIRNNEPRTPRRNQSGTQRNTWERQPQERDTGPPSRPTNQQRRPRGGQEQQENTEQSADEERDQNKEKQWDIPSFLRVQQKRDKRRN